MKKVNILTKAQISTFIILGLLAFLIFGFIFYVVKSTTEQVVEESTEKVIIEALRKESISSYVTLCLDRSLRQGLNLIGKQGGYIYKDQPGSIIPFKVSSTNYEQEDVTYLIEPIPSKPPWYPCFTPKDHPVYCGFVNNFTLFPDVFKYTFGTSRLPFLYKNQGLYSIQEQLESYISYHTKKCSNFTGLVTLEQYEFYNITEGNVSAEVLFHENDVSVILNYPVSIQIPEYAPVTDLLEFKSTAKVRFRKIYDAAKEIIQKDNNFLDYDIIIDTESRFYLGEHLKFSEIPEAHIIKKIINTFDDIIIINDSLSKTNGDSYIFQFVRKNRNPVLDYINISTTEQGQSIIIKPNANDPDEDLVSFSLSGENANKFNLIGDNTYKYTPPSSEQGTPLSVGYYPFNLSTSDAQLSDYQIVEILVCDENIGQDQKCDSRCGADARCHLESVNTKISNCDFGSTYLIDECSGSCQLKDSTFCGSLGTSATCKSHSECDLRSQYATKSNGWCYGIDGCEMFCTNDLVDRNNNFNQTYPQADAADECGCTPSNENSRCYKKPYANPNEIYYCISGVCQ